MFKRIDHVEIIAKDFDASLKFYTEILGFKVKQQMQVDAAPLQEIAYLELGDTVLELMRVDEPTAVDDDDWRMGYRMMALEVEDMDKALWYLAGKGVAITWGPVKIGPSKRVEIHDVDGFPIELRQW